MPISCQAQVTAEGWPVAAVQEEKGILMGGDHQQSEAVRDLRKLKEFLCAELFAVTVAARSAGRG